MGVEPFIFVARTMTTAPGPESPSGDTVGHRSATPPGTANGLRPANHLCRQGMGADLQGGPPCAYGCQRCTPAVTPPIWTLSFDSTKISAIIDCVSAGQRLH